MWGRREDNRGILQYLKLKRSLASWSLQSSRREEHYTDICEMMIVPGGWDGKSVCLQCGKPGFGPWVRKIPWRRKWQPTPVLLPGKSHGWRSLVGCSPWGCKESDTIEWLHFHSHLRCDRGCLTARPPAEEEILDDLPREGWVWLTKRGRAAWTLGGKRVVSEEGGFQTQVAEERKSPVVRGKKIKSGQIGNVEEIGSNRYFKKV